jgi:hypothetical protein
MLKIPFGVYVRYVFTIAKSATPPVVMSIIDLGLQHHEFRMMDRHAANQKPPARGGFGGVKGAVG